MAQYFCYDPEKDRRLFEPGSGSRVFILYFCFFFKDNKAHNVHDKEVHYQIQSRIFIHANRLLTVPKVSFK